MNKYGWQGLVVSAVLYFALKIITNNINNINLSLSKIYKKSDISLENHSFFNAINYALNVELHAITVFANKPIRQAIVKDLIYCSLSTLEEICETISKIDHSGMDYAKWNFAMRSNINSMDQMFIKKCNDRGIPPVVYLKYFQWYGYRMEKMREFIDQISGSKRFSVIETKTYALLMMFHMFVSVMMADAECAMNSLNGEITGLPYKGGFIEALEH